MKALLLLTLPFCCAIATAQIYRVVDPKTGEVSYTNQPVPGAVRLATGEANKEGDRRTNVARAEPSTRDRVTSSETTSAYVLIADSGGATYSLNVRAFPGGLGLTGAWVMTNWSEAQVLTSTQKAPLPRSRFDNSDSMQALADALVAPTSYRSALTLYRLRCAARTMYPEETILYEQKFGQGKVVRRDLNGGPGDNVVPGTLNETLLERICAQMRARGIASF